MTDTCTVSLPRLSCYTAETLTKQFLTRGCCQRSCQGRDRSITHHHGHLGEVFTFEIRDNGILPLQCL